MLNKTNISIFLLNIFDILVKLIIFASELKKH